MALSLSDFFVTERGGNTYKITGADILAMVREYLGTTDYQVPDIDGRNDIINQSIGDMVLVDDASADASVTLGWAIYQWVGSWQKRSEEESLDIVITTTNLGVTRTASAVTVTNSDGTDATIPVSTSTLAGVISAANTALLELITVTNAIDLDVIASASHTEMTAIGTASTNPLFINANQVIGFSISQLADLPA